MVKRLLNWLKTGVQAGFGPNFTVEFEAEIPKKLDWPTEQLRTEFYLCDFRQTLLQNVLHFSKAD